jgi:hypothetical protein
MFPSIDGEINRYGRHVSSNKWIMQKHLDLLVANSTVVKEGQRYVRID